MNRSTIRLRINTLVTAASLGLAYVPSAIAQPALPPKAKADSAKTPAPLFTRKDFVIGGAFVVGTVAMFPFDERLANHLTNPGAQANKFFKNAAEPTSPLSPFSPQSSPARAAAIEQWREVLAGSDTKVPNKLQADLPELLWLYFMGVVLFFPDGVLGALARLGRRVWRLLGRRSTVDPRLAAPSRTAL